MSQKTIQARLVTTESSRRAIWELMAERNTPLVNALLEYIATRPDFEDICSKGSIAQATVKEYCQELRQNPQFSGQPGRFYTSAIVLVTRIFKSWLRLRSRLIYRLEGKIHWLQILQSDEDLCGAGACSLEMLRAEATQILSQLAPDPDQAMPAAGASTQPSPRRRRRKPQNTTQEKNQIKQLFQLYRDTSTPCQKAAIAYLLKYGGKLSPEAEDPKKFAKRRRKAEIAVERLTDTLRQMRAPNGRDLTGQRWLETLETAASKAPKDEAEAALWQAILLSEASSFPFPVTYETNEDLSWFINDKGRICVSFNGLADHTFKIYCDQRQLHWFKRFLEDQQIKKVGKNQHSAALFTLRSARIAWQRGQGQGDPWTVHQLTLFCTIETDFWTAAGTEKLRQEKATECAKVLESTKRLPSND